MSTAPVPTRAPRTTHPAALPNSSVAASGTRLVPAVERAVRVLDALAQSRQGASLAEMSRALDLPKSSVHGLLGTLTALDLVRRTPEGGFALGPRPLQWASAYSVQSDVIAAFQEAATQAGPLSSETIMLAVLDGADVLYLGCRQGTRALAVNFRVGGRFPASCTSSGKAILASLAPHRLAELWPSPASLPRPTRHSIASLTALSKQLARVRRDGFAIDDEEMAEGMQCFGAPVFAAGKPEAVAAVAVSLIKAATSPARRTQAISAIRSLADALSERLGASPSLSPPAQRLG